MVVGAVQALAESPRRAIQGSHYRWYTSIFRQHETALTVDQVSFDQDYFLSKIRVSTLTALSLLPTSSSPSSIPSNSQPSPITLTRPNGGPGRIQNFFCQTKVSASMSSLHLSATPSFPSSRPSSPRKGTLRPSRPCVSMATLASLSMAFRS